MPGCLKDYRCPQCRKLLFRGLLVEGEVEIKCRHCHALSVQSASLHDGRLCLVDPCPNRVPFETKK